MVLSAPIVTSTGIGLSLVFFSTLSKLLKKLSVSNFSSGERLYFQRPFEKSGPESKTPEEAA